jgi:hypothetical protein
VQTIEPPHLFQQRTGERGTMDRREVFHEDLIPRIAELRYNGSTARGMIVGMSPIWGHSTFSGESYARGASAKFRPIGEELSEQPCTASSI